jgi:putative membrane protein
MSVSFSTVLTHWSFEPSVVVVLLAAIAGFAWLQRRAVLAVSIGRRICFGAAIVLLALALLSPLDEISDRYLLVGHMVQHLILVLLIAPLLVRAIPRTWGQRLTINPWLAFAAFNVVFALSHVQLWYEATLVHEPLHLIEHVLYLGTAMLNWLPVLNPARELRLPDAMQMLYLFFETLPMFVVGALLSLSETPIYAFYLRAPRLAGIGPVEDQSMAGLLMWIGGSFFYLGALTIVFFRWANREMTPDHLQEEQWLRPTSLSA